MTVYSISYLSRFLRDDLVFSFRFQLIIIFGNRIGSILSICPCPCPCRVRIFHWHNSSGRTMALGVDSASNRNGYQECFLGVKAAGAQGWQPCHLRVPIVMKSGSLNLLEPSGPVIGLLYFTNIHFWSHLAVISSWSDVLDRGFRANQTTFYIQ
jgi:hypothetical protein